MKKLVIISRDLSIQGTEAVHTYQYIADLEMVNYMIGFIERLVAQYLAECGTANLQPDSILIENTINRTKPAMVYLMDRAIGYYADAQITGIVYGFDGLPLEGAVIELLEHNGSVLKPRLTNEFGRYRRVVDVGTYNLLVKQKDICPSKFL